MFSYHEWSWNYGLHNPTEFYGSQLDAVHQWNISFMQKRNDKLDSYTNQSATKATRL